MECFGFILKGFMFSPIYMFRHTSPLLKKVSPRKALQSFFFQVHDGVCDIIYLLLNTRYASLMVTGFVPFVKCLATELKTVAKSVLIALKTILSYLKLLLEWSFKTFKYQATRCMQWPVNLLRRKCGKAEVDWSRIKSVSSDSLMNKHQSKKESHSIGSMFSSSRIFSFLM